MAAARYWRIVGIETYAGAALEISALHLYDGASRVDAAATLTCSHAPAGGALSNLQDANTATVARFDASAIRSGGFAISWDFGTATTVDTIQLGSSISDVGFPDALTLEYFDGRWQVLLAADRCTYPGASQMGVKMYPSAPVGTVLMDSATAGGDVTLSNGNTRASFSGLGNARGTLAVASGVWQFECKVINDASLYAIFGVGLASTSNVGFPGIGPTTVGWWNRNGSLYRNNVATSYSSGYFAGDTLGCVVDRDAATVAFYRNGVTAGAVALGFSGDTLPIFGNGNAGIITPGSLVFELSTTLAYPVSGAIQWPVAFGVSGLIPKRIITKSSSAFVGASAALGGFTTAVCPPLMLARDIEHGGPGTIYGTTKTKGTPANTPTKARVVLQHQRSKLPVRETWSDPVTGNFAFTDIDTTQQFLTLAEDAAGNFRPVAANRLTPEVLP